MDADKQTADKILSLAMCVLALAVSRRKRESALGVGYIITSDPSHSRGIHGSLPGHNGMVESSPTVLRLVREKLRKRSVGPADAGPVIRLNSLNRPWFDVTVNESPHEIVMKVAKIHPIKT